ncbi:MAG: anti-sigma factor [Candidatus Binatia bacterium]|jgi:anti-sigma factor RsiW
MSACPAFQDLNALIDGALPREEEVVLRRHLDGCAACRRWVDGVNALRQAVGRAYGSAVPSPALQRAVRASLPKRRHWWWAGVVAGPFLLASGAFL